MNHYGKVRCMHGSRLLPCLLILALFSKCSAQNAEPRLISGNFVGLEKMASLSPDDPATRWYHENTLFIRNNEFILDQAPVTIRRGKKTYSASDGGFLVYRGEIFIRDHKTYAAMRLFSSDYVMFRSGPKECEPYSRITMIPISITDGLIRMNGVMYRPKPAPDASVKVWAEELTSESVEYTGKAHYIDPHAPACPLPAGFKSH